MTIGAYQEPTPRLFVQGLYDESSTALQRLGTIRKLDDGRVFAYSRAGAAALAVGKLTAGMVVETAHLECVASDAAIGASSLTITPGNAAAAADLYKDGYAWINKNTGIGHLYKIRGHKAITASTAFVLNLYDPLRVALASSAEVSFVQHPQANVLIHGSLPVAWLCGVPPIAVTALYYFWNQVKGPCCVLTEGTLVAGKTVVPSTSVDGAVAPPALTEAGPNTGFDQQICGTVVTVNVTAEYSLINLAIPGY